MVVVKGEQVSGGSGGVGEGRVVESLYMVGPVLLALWRLLVLTWMRSQGEK